jgi:hypothetical protein
MREARREIKAITCKIACLEGRLGMTDIIVAPPYRPLAPVSANTPPLTASSQPAAGAAQSIRRISITDILNPAQPDQQPQASPLPTPLKTPGRFPTYTQFFIRQKSISKCPRNRRRERRRNPDQTHLLDRATDVANGYFQQLSRPAPMESKSI